MPSLSPAQRAALERCSCEVRCDPATRCLYATDASIYQLEPRAVALPRSLAEAAEVVRVAAEQGLPVTPRGAGTGLTGGALGDGLVVEMALGARTIGEPDPERRTIRVGAGAVLDRLNAAVAAHGLWFGPDVATSSRATIGGMVANDSSGAHAPVYGTTADHLEALEVVLADGRVALLGAPGSGERELAEAADALVARHAAAIGERMPPILVKRWPGYAFDRYLRRPGDLATLVAGSEGTLALITAAVLRLTPRPARRGLGIVVFASVAEAMAATVELARLGPAAIEHLDRILLDQTRGRREFAAARELLDLDRRPAEALLLVELFDQRVDDGLAELEASRLGQRRFALRDEADQELVWALRRAGLSLLTSRAGPAKPTSAIEDVCVPPERLPAYVEELRAILDPVGLEASFYGHAASGLLHVRPVLDLASADGVAGLRRVADQVATLARRFGASLAGEHGVGIARTEYLEPALGDELAAATRELKALFDPGALFNPGKIVGDGRFAIDRNLRRGAGYRLATPIDGVFGWLARDHSPVANLEQCNGCGGCRKEAPTMCPTFVASGEEALSTRGRANIVRAALEGRFAGDPLAADELAAALASCLACKACERECPSNVDLAALKAELLHARHLSQGIPLLDRLVAAADTLGRLGTAAPRLANALLGWRPGRRLLERWLGLAADAPLPPFAFERFDRWFAARAPAGGGGRGKVLLWDDTWVRYHEPAIGRAAVAVLEAAGYQVELVEGRRCCGRPAASRGLLDELRRLGEHNLALLRRLESCPVVFLEPSCHSVFVDEYVELEVEGAAEVAARCLLFEELLDRLLERAPEALDLAPLEREVAIHVHCHPKALGDSSTSARLAARLPGATARTLATGCCGMAGAFGMMAANSELSLAVARPLVEQIEALPDEALLVASGTSCRHQIERLTGRHPLHIAELLASAVN